MNNNDKLLEKQTKKEEVMDKILRINVPSLDVS